MFDYLVLDNQFEVSTLVKANFLTQQSLITCTFLSKGGAL